ncbi:hypothetical protein OROMI_003857 [Orobanche minor]
MCYAPPFQGNIAASYGTSYDAADQYHRGNFAILDSDNFFDSNVNSGSYGGASSSIHEYLQPTQEQGSEGIINQKQGRENQKVY